ncbi:hypothetical protein MBLNU230_g8602t1 [Neophaeotheca triangularis]
MNSIQNARFSRKQEEVHDKIFAELSDIEKGDEKKVAMNNKERATIPAVMPRAVVAKPPKAYTRTSKFGGEPALQRPKKIKRTAKDLLDDPIDDDDDDDDDEPPKREPPKQQRLPFPARAMHRHRPAMPTGIRPPPPPQPHQRPRFINTSAADKALEESERMVKYLKRKLKQGEEESEQNTLMRIELHGLPELQEMQRYLLYTIAIIQKAHPEMMQKAFLFTGDVFDTDRWAKLEELKEKEFFGMHSDWLRRMIDFARPTSITGLGDVKKE